MTTMTRRMMVMITEMIIIIDYMRKKYIRTTLNAQIELTFLGIFGLLHFLRWLAHSGGIIPKFPIVQFKTKEKENKRHSQIQEVN